MSSNRLFDLSVIIVNYRSWDDLELCLGSLRALRETAPLRCQVIVVDNASGDGRMADFERRFPWVSFIVSGNNYGYAHGCNLGAAAASGRELLFLNPDCLDPGDQIQGLYAIKLGAPEVAILAPRQTDERGRAQKTGDRFPGLIMLIGPLRALARAAAPKRFANTRKITAGLHPVDWVSGSALLISADALERLGGWCEAFWMYSEDVDLCRRAANLGLATAVTGEITLIHRHGGASRATTALTILTKSEAVISKHLYASRHLPVPRRWLFHLLLLASRYLSRLPAALLAPLVPWRRLRIDAGVFAHLSGYYLGAARSGHWISPHSVRFRRGKQLD